MLDIAAAAARFGVSTKTIQRWRRKGLTARRFVFADGKRRVGFLLSAVERFVAAGDAAGAAESGAMGDAELDRAAAHARRLAPTCDAAEVCRRVARRLGRTPAAVLHHLRHHDALRPDRAVLPHVRPAATAGQRKQILAAADAGAGLAAAAAAGGVSARAAARALVGREADRLADLPARYVDDPVLSQPDAAAVVAELCRAGELADARPAARVPAGLPAYLAELYRTPLLTPARERALFLRYNLHRKAFAGLRAALDPAVATRRELARLRRAHEAATATKNLIVRANLRLVVSVARKHLRPGLDLMELVSDGNLVLMRAVDGFDTGRGHKFSTYATLALMKGYARSVPQLRARIGGGDAALAACPDRARPAPQRLAEAEAADRLLARLDDRERAVLLGHQGLELDPSGRLREAGAAATLDELGRELGLTRHHVRQIERGALEKLRD